MSEQRDAGADDPSGGRSAPTPAAKLGSRRGWRWLILTPALVVGFLGVAVLSLPWLLSPKWVRDTAVSALTNDLGISAEIGRLDYHPLTGVALTDVRVKPPPGFERDVLTADRIEVRYSLWPLITGEVAVRSVAIENAHLVYETSGETNSLDALLARIDDALGPSEPDDTPPSPSAPSSLTPVGVRVHDIAIGPVTLEVAGDGPTARLSGVWLRARGRLGTQTLTASAALSVEPAAGERNFSFSIPTGEGATTGRLSARLQIPIDLEADTSAGFVPGRTEAAVDLGIFGLVERPRGPLPPVDLSAQVAASADPQRGRAAVTKLRVALDGRTLLDAHARARGLWSTVQGLVGPASAPRVARSAGLATDDPTPDYLEAEVRVLHLPLSEIEPLAVAVLPELQAVAGRLEARGLRVAGGLSALLDGRPPELTGRLTAQRVGCRWPSTLMLGQLDGTLAADRRDDATRAYSATGRFDVAALEVAGQRLGRGALSIDANVEQIDAATGATSATVTLAVTDLATPPVVARSARAEVVLSGRDPLVLDRRPTAPVSVRAAVRASDVKVGRVVSARRADVTASVDADRILDAARQPWKVAVGADVQQLAVPSFRTKTGRVRIEGTLGDVRRPGFSTDLTVDGQFERPASTGFLSRRVALEGRVRADDIRSRVADGLTTAATMPGRVAVTLDARASRARYRDLVTPLSVHLDGDLDFDTGRLRVRSGRVGLGPQAKLTVSGRLLRLLRGELAGRVRARLAVPDLDRVWRRVPDDLRGSVADLRTQGAVFASLDVGGRWPRSGARIDWSRPPARGRFRLRSQQVGVSSERLGLDIQGLTATVAARLAPNVAMVTPQLEASRVAYGTQVAAEGFLLDGSVGLEDQVWRSVAVARAERITTEVDGRRLSDAAAVDVNARYVPNGDLAIERLDLRFPSAGLVFGARGRLRRGNGRALVPDLRLDGQIDLTPLAVLVPALAPGRGRVFADLDIKPGPSDTLRVGGRAQVDGLDWTTPSWSLRRAAGAAPVRQTLHLPSVATAATGGRGVLGDDLEARLRELIARLQAVQLVVDPGVDILAAAPRTADHYALVPYRRAVDAELVAAELRVGQTTLNDLRAEARLEEGVLRIDRFQAGLWEGDLLFDVALQVTPELDMKTRMRGTMTDLNLDIPYARAKGISAVTDPDEKAEYLASGVMDFEFGLNQRTLDGQLDVVRLSRALVDRLFGALDPSGKSSAAEALGYSELAAVRPVSAKIWIAQNLLNVQFEWERVLGFDDLAPWWLALDTVLLAPRVVSAWILGGAWVIPTVNNSVKRASVFNFLDPYVGPTLNRTSALLSGFQARVVSSADLPGLVASSAE